MGFILRMKGWFNIQKSSNVTHHINRIKDKNQLIISKNEGESCDKTQYPFMIKTPCKLGREMNSLNLIKGISEKHMANTANIIFNEERLTAFILKSGRK